MISIWMIIGLILATVSVSVLGASFSVVGIGALFSGAMIAVVAMATSLEFAKFVLAAYLHQRWKHLNGVFKAYLLFAIVVLSVITSMGIFGFLSDAYSSASAVLDTENVKLESYKTQLENNKAELARLDKIIDDIPANRVTKRLQVRAGQEPIIADLNKKTLELEAQITTSNLAIIEVKKKVGPLIYISRAFDMDIDSVVKYLILILVLVFDPLAICLVIATTEALNQRRLQALYADAMGPAAQAVAPSTAFTFSGVNPATPPAPATAPPAAATQPVAATPPPAEPAQQELIAQQLISEPAPAAESKPDHPIADDPAVEEVLQMRFADDKDKNAV